MKKEKLIVAWFGLSLAMMVLFAESILVIPALASFIISARRLSKLNIPIDE